MISSSVHKFFTSEVGRIASGNGVDEEVIARTEEREKVNHIGWAAFVEGGEKDSREDGLEGEGSHLSAERSDATFRVDRGEAMQGEKGRRDLRGRELV